MKKTKLLTSLAAFVLVLGLGACDTTSEEETTPSESESTTETTGTSESTPTTPSEDPDGYVLVGDFADSNWDAKVDASSKYYIPLGTTEYKATVTIAAEPDYGTYEPWAAGLRVVEWGDSWNLVVGSDDLAEGSAEGLYGDDSKNIKVSWGETYDITVTFGETNSILVTVHEDGGDEGETTPTLLGFDVDGVINYIDGGLVGNYSYEGSITTNIDEAIPVNCLEAEDGGYYLTFDKNETTYYICIVPVTSSSGTFTDLQYETTPTAIYYDDDLDGWVNDDGTYFLCYNASYKCLYASAIAEYGPSGSKGTSPIAHLYDYPTIEGIELSAGSQEVYVTSTLNITVTYTPSTIGASNLTWESSDEEVATVDGGVVTGVAVGEVTITATTLNGLTATITLEVVAAPADEELSVEITPESLAAECGNTVDQQMDISGHNSTYGNGALTIAWTGGGTGIKPWNGVSNSNNVSTIRIYSGASFTISNGTGSVSRVVIDAAWSSSNSSNGCGTSFSATNATVGTAVTTSLGDEVEITLNSDATSTTISRSGSVCYCSGITVYYYAA